MLGVAAKQCPGEGRGVPHPILPHRTQPAPSLCNPTPHPTTPPLLAATHPMQTLTGWVPHPNPSPAHPPPNSGPPPSPPPAHPDSNRSPYPSPPPAHHRPTPQPTPSPIRSHPAHPAPPGDWAALGCVTPFKQHRSRRQGCSPKWGRGGPGGGGTTSGGAGSGGVGRCGGPWCRSEWGELGHEGYCWRRPGSLPGNEL